MPMTQKIGEIRTIHTECEGSVIVNRMIQFFGESFTLKIFFCLIRTSLSGYRAWSPPDQDSIPNLSSNHDAAFGFY